MVKKGDIVDMTGKLYRVEFEHSYQYVGKKVVYGYDLERNGIYPNTIFMHSEGLIKELTLTDNAILTSITI